MAEKIGKAIREDIVCLRATLYEINSSIRNYEEQTDKILVSESSFSDESRNTLLQVYLEKLNSLKCQLSDVQVKHKFCKKCTLEF